MKHKCYNNFSIEGQSTSRPHNGATDQLPNAMVYEQKLHNHVVDVMKCIILCLSFLGLSPFPLFADPISILNLTTVRLVSSPALSMPTGLERRRSLQLVTVLTECRAADTLIGVWCLLNSHLLMPALARAAAHAQSPEKTRCDAECDANPHDLQHLVAHGGVDVVGLECGVEDAGQNAVDASCGCGGGDGEYRRSLIFININVLKL